jgi:glycosyltransferase involved in cell wall biosynthesis
MTNLVLFYCDRMQGFFGLGTHVHELVSYFKKQKDIRVTIVFTETEKYPECTFIREDGIDMLYIPCPQNGLFLSPEDSPVANMLAQRILQIVCLYIGEKENLVCWFNSMAELNLLKQIKENLPWKTLYVHHGWAWKNVIRVEDDVFAKEWKNGNVAFCPPAFEDATRQLQMAEYADQVVTVTKQAHQYFENVFDIPSHKLTTIYNGINTAEFDKFNKQAIKRELGIPEQEQVILFTGRVVENKGVFFLVDAFKQLLERNPGCRLVLAGTGTLGEVLRACKPIWSKVILTDFIEREWMQKWYAIADVGILPSLMEQCSYSAIEMRFWRIPIIVSAVDGLDEVFEHGEDCLKIPVHHDQNGERIFSPKEICDCLYALLTDQAIGKKISDNGYQKATENFTLERMGNNYLDTLRNMSEPVVNHQHA